MRKAQIHIVGAGITGLVTALMLSDSGISVVMSEAAAKSGGRIRTCDIYGWPVNLGPSWLHDGPENFLFQWLFERYMRSDKRHYDAKGIFRNIESNFILDTVNKAITITREGISGNERRDAARAWLDAQAEIVEGNGRRYSIGELVQGNKSAAAYFDYGARNWAAIKDAFHYDYKEYAEDPTSDGGYQPVLGMEEMLAPMLREIDGLGIPIHHNCPISQIAKHGNSYHLIGSQGQQFDAEHIVLAIPKPALEKLVIDPPLTDSPHIVRALSDIQNSQMNKIIVPFESNFLADAIEPNTHIRVLTAKPSHFSFARPAGSPFVFLFAGGDLAQQAEQWDSQKVADFVDDSLSRVPMLKGHKKFRTGAALVTKHHELFGCAYSALRVGGERAGGPQIHDGRIIVANADIVGLEQSAGTLAGACHAGVATAKMTVAMCQNG